MERTSIEGGRRPDCDVAVVGASAAGLRAAGLLALAGRRVAVFDARPTVGHPERSWIVTRQIGPVLGFQPDPAVLHETGTMRVTAGDAARDVRLQPPDLIVERARLLSLLAGRAETAGAELWIGHRVTEITPRESGVDLRVESTLNGHRPVTVRARHLIGADGVRSCVARAFGATPFPSVPIVQAVVRLPDGRDLDVTQVWFEPERTRYFYWLIPHSEREGVVGLVADDRGDARAALDDFLERHDLRAREYQAAMIPLYRPGRRIDWELDGGARVLLVGDAAGHVKATTVGGVVSGLWGARAAADALLTGRRYARELRDLNRELGFHALLRWVLHRFGRDDHEALIRSLNDELTALLSRQNRDSMAPNALDLFKAQPRILALGLRAVITGLPARNGTEADAFRAPETGRAGGRGGHHPRGAGVGSARGGSDGL